MKNITALLLGLSFIVSSSAMAETNVADQKWLEAAQKVIAKAESRVSTPSHERVMLLKEWAEKKGQVVIVTKTELGYRVELSKSVAQR